MTHLTKLWIAVAAVAITALLTIAAGLLASLAMGVILGDHAKWRPLVISGSMIMGWMTPFVVVGIGAYRRRVRRETFPHLAGLRRLPR